MDESEKFSKENKRVCYKAITYCGETYVNILILKEIIDRHADVSFKGVKRLYELSKEYAVDISKDVKR